MKKAITLWVNATLVTCETTVGIIKQGAIAIQGENILWVGSMKDIPNEYYQLAEQVHDVEGRCITPGLIDCHTHLVYAGNRAHEFEMRLKGMSYTEIAKQGGGIYSTVKATRAASEDSLYEQSKVRALHLMQDGVTTLEIKSGYGLDWETEVKMLSVAKRLEETLPLTVKRTFLGAHTLPAEFQGKGDAYVDMLCNEMIPRVAQDNLAEAVDVFCEHIAFNLAQTEKIFACAKSHQLAVKCHAEQLSASGSAKLAAQYHALSVDHLEFLNEEGVKALAQAGTVAVLLPSAFYFLRETQYPPIEALRAHGVPMALASDCNPGTSPILSLLSVLNMGCTLFRLTPDEALMGVTMHAAQALGIEKTLGSLSKGKIADFIVWDVGHPVELIYYLGNRFLYQRVKEGRLT